MFTWIIFCQLICSLTHPIETDNEPEEGHGYNYDLIVIGLFFLFSLPSSIHPTLHRWRLRWPSYGSGSSTNKPQQEVTLAVCCPFSSHSSLSHLGLLLWILWTLPHLELLGDWVEHALYVTNKHLHIKLTMFNSLLPAERWLYSKEVNASSKPSWWGNERCQRLWMGTPWSRNQT